MSCNPASRAERLAALLLCGVLAACSPSSVEQAERELRTDTEPLTSRFPAIGTPVSATWVTWNNADPRVPGPTTYWIDAVITLQPQTARALADLAPATHVSTPEVAEEVRAEVSGGPFVTGTALNGALSTPGWAATGYLDDARNLLVLNAVGD
ncbi:hypothetical protein PDG61_26280 [Mycolicibacterium sp. BiH015]|uniref:hypothetical protein n=1 Tax=Mycolicibacterium sp. BiH015 TaxID=3018808 RepID=UPI0022E84888|nr:hypothetical protein [Mycolicibacterium sp. BiH015]MDA2894442.1 hypothetical protein [Mycolicibacterium sp. BiH015]